ncbi:hypothetical protein EV356DRAFT_511262 [Viridothelium virens]|uniref:Serine hydrolase domain-containing protein n=1 Tax=Viridothelium virens TaxID=1048519 RepID=A0A6A6HQ87_VIRVR|nr:hypothetical protein EV356DRAFT_511262 [Viridothelium virens]
MKFLCLHGKGTSAQILEVQTAGFRALLPEHYEYRFFDGEEDSDSYPAISSVFPGPYFCYYKDNSMKSVKAAHEYVGEIIEDEVRFVAPYPELFLFRYFAHWWSLGLQGAALAASVILYHQIEHPLALPLFRFAVFICGDLPFTRSPNLGVDVTEQYIKDGVMHGDVVNEPEQIVEMKRSASGRSSLKLSTDSGYTSDEEGASTRTVRRFVPEIDKERIQIPTVHIYGAEDIDLKKSLALTEMCDERLSEKYMHHGGHSIPRAEDVHQKIVEVVQAAAVKSELMS